MRERGMGPFYTAVLDTSYEDLLYRRYYDASTLLVGSHYEAPGTDLCPLKWEASMTDYVTPNFARERRLGKIINNPMSQSRTEWRCKRTTISGGATWYTSTQGYGAIHTINGQVHPSHFGMCDDEAYPSLIRRAGQPVYLGWGGASTTERSRYASEAAGECWAKMADAPLSAWVLVGEFNETVQTVVWTLQKCRDLLNLLFKSKRRTFARELKRRLRSGKVLRWEDLEELTDAYLQVRYGLRPLMYDLAGALEALQALGQQTRQRFGARIDEVETGSITNDVIMTKLNPNGDSSFSPTYATQLTGTCSMQARAGLLAHPVFEEANLATVMGAGEIVKGAWDLVPYSFVIDWFTNIGTVLTSWSPNAFVHVLASWAVLTEVETTTHDVVLEGSGYTAVPWGFGSPDVENLTIDPGHIRAIVRTVERIPNPPRAIMPKLDINFDVLKAVDLAALVKNFGMFRGGF